MMPQIQKVQTQTLPLAFPLYTLDPEGDDRKQSPFAMEVDQQTGQMYALLFTSEENVRLYRHRRGVGGGTRVIRDAVEMLRLGQQLLTKFQIVSRFAIDPSGGRGPVHFAQVQDLLFAARDATRT